MVEKQRSQPGVSIEDLHLQLREAIDTIESGDQWQAWLDFAHRLHRYSFNNLILIWQQCPTASAVASYKAWQAMDHHVRRGEKAIRVMAPILRRVSIPDTAGQQKENDQSQKAKQQIVGFRAVPVFDVSQTDGPPLPERVAPELLRRGAPVGLWDALVSEISEHGYRVMRGSAETTGGANGLTRFTEREVCVRDDLHDAQAVKTLAHELAHVILHSSEGDRDAERQCRGIEEVEAESVAHLIMAAHHVDTGAYTFPYVAGWAYPLAAVEQVPMSEIVTRTGSRVMKAAHQVIEATTSAARAQAEPVVTALSARVSASRDATADLRDQAAGAALPNVERNILLGVVADSHDYFQRQLPRSWVPHYLAERHLAGAIDSHQLGYATKSWTGLVDHLRDIGYSDDHIEAAGMATRTRTGKLIDRMRDRLIIPLRTERDGCVAFTGRAAPDTNDPFTPKYLNTPTTSIFKKGELLYGLADHRAVARDDQPVVCEGPLDAIAVDLLAANRRLEIFGVATSGTAFTDAHAAILRSSTRGQPIYLAFDGDSAGSKAAESSWKAITATVWRPVRIVELPIDSDPASLHQSDLGSLAGLIETARSAGTVVAERQIDAANLSGHAGREVSAFRALVPLATRMPRDERVPYLLMLADKLRLDAPFAAALVADINPKVMMEQVAETSRKLSEQLSSSIENGLSAMVAESTPMSDANAVTTLRR